MKLFKKNALCALISATALTCVSACTNCTAGTTKARPEVKTEDIRFLTPTNGIAGRGYWVERPDGSRALVILNTMSGGATVLE